MRSKPTPSKSAPTSKTNSTSSKPATTEPTTAVTSSSISTTTQPTAPKGTPEELHGWLSNLDAVPEKIRTAVRNHGGGHFNHDLFWNSLTPNPTEPTGELKDALGAAFGSGDAAMAEYLDKGGKIFGSGWVWLVFAFAGNVAGTHLRPLFRLD